MIRFLMAENLSSLAIHEQLQNVNGVNVIPECTVCSWIHRFCKEKWENIHAAKRCGQPTNTYLREIL